MKSTNRQLQQAKELHDSGVSWKIIASYLYTNINTLRQQMKTYEDDINNN